MTRSRTRDGRRETRATGTDRLVAQLSTHRGVPMSGGDVARMTAEARRRLLMRLGFLSGRATGAELRAALPGAEPPRRGRPPLPDAERRSVRVEVRLTEAEYSALLDQVDEETPSVSEVIRQRALG